MAQIAPSFAAGMVRSIKVDACLARLDSLGARLDRLDAKSPAEIERKLEEAIDRYQRNPTPKNEDRVAKLGREFKEAERAAAAQRRSELHN